MTTNRFAPVSRAVSSAPSSESGRAPPDLEALFAEALERIRRGARFERTAAHHGRPRLRDRCGDPERLLLALDRAGAGHQRELAAADRAAPDADHRVGG